MKVKINIETSTKAPKTKRAVYKYTMECQAGERSGTGTLEDCTYYQLVLTAMREALKRMIRPSEIEICTDCKYAIYSFGNLDAWSKNNWKRAGEKEIANVCLWKELYKLKQKHEITLHFAVTNGRKETGGKKQ